MSAVPPLSELPAPPEPRGRGALARAFALPDPDQTSPRWHVTWWVDALAYHWSWVPILLPIAFLGKDPDKDYWLAMVIAVTLGTTHRHAMFPYVYLDRQVFLKHPIKFGLIPLLLFAGFLATPALASTRFEPLSFTSIDALAMIGPFLLAFQGWLATRREHAWSVRSMAALMSPYAVAALVHLGVPDLGMPALHGAVWLLASLCASAIMAVDVARTDRGGAATWGVPVFLGAATLGLVAAGGATAPSWPATRTPGRTVFDAVVIFAAVWNIWHVFMQKYGILRLYNAKSEAPVDRKVPGWVDRLLLFGWLPLLFVWMGPRNRDAFAAAGSRVSPVMHRIADVMEAGQPVLLPLALGVGLFTLGSFLYYEHRATGLKNPARVGMALGTTLLLGSFFVVDPVKAYVAFGFSHAVEYSVFIWAFQRRRYAHKLAHDPLWGRMLRFPLLSYGGFLVLVSVLYLYGAYSTEVFGVDAGSWLGTKTFRWVFYWTVWQSMMHFYFDGFLWKMRLPAVRATI